MTGIELVRKKLHRYQDGKRYRAYLNAREALSEQHNEERETLTLRHKMRGQDLARKLRALDQVERRERRSLETAFRRQDRMRQRGGRAQMPAVELDATRSDRAAAPERPKHRYVSPLARKLQEVAAGRRPARIRLADVFASAAGKEREEEAGEGSSRGPERRSRSSDRSQRPRDRDPDQGRER